MKKLLFYIITMLAILQGMAQGSDMRRYNVIWNSPSENASGSMPCGGGDIGLNVWAEQGDLFFYIARSGTFDENNQMLKLGRVRLHIPGKAFAESDFKQELHLNDGSVTVDCNGMHVLIWVDVYHPVVHLELDSRDAVKAELHYESWRYEDRKLDATSVRGNSYKVKQPFDVVTYKDSISFNKGIYFFHRNRIDLPSVFDRTVVQQGLASIKQQLYDPLYQNTFGGTLIASSMVPAGMDSGTYQGTPFRSWKLKTSKPLRQLHMYLAVPVMQTAAIKTFDEVLAKELDQAQKNVTRDHVRTKLWWQQFWERSFIHLTGADSSMAKQYQRFRYMMGCNARGQWPTKFNGGLFTFDPGLVSEKYRSPSADFRLWGGGTFTAQNQRLVYFPLLRSGDVDMMRPQFEFYLRVLKNAEARTAFYWQHGGASFTEQIENFGLPNYFEYGMKRPEGYDAGMEYNKWLEYQWETVFEFCFMILEAARYENLDIRTYIPLIERSLDFYDAHYRYIAAKKGTSVFDTAGNYIFYPSSAAETFKLTNNSITVIAALKTVLQRVLELPSTYVLDRDRWSTMLSKIPPLPLSNYNGHATLAPALSWERVQNTETPQLYPVFPWGIYGVGRPDLELARNTYRYDTFALKFKSAIGWRQYNIFAARLGLTEDALALNREKFLPGPHRFPAFWGPGFDWTPDHNWGGTAMIGLQEMLLQTDGKKIYLLPACPATWSGHFKLHAPYQTTVEAFIENGKVKKLIVLPASRLKDVVYP